MTRVVMAGAANFAQEVREACTAAGLEVVAMIEGIDQAKADPAHDPPIVWADEQRKVEPDLPLVIGIGQVKRMAFIERLEAEGRRLGRGTVVNRGATIGHHTVIGPHSFVGPGANVAGEVIAGEQVHIAVGATVRDNLVIGDRAVIGAGAAAVKDVPADTIVVGVPARPLARP